MPDLHPHRPDQVVVPEVQRIELADGEALPASGTVYSGVYAFKREIPGFAFDEAVSFARARPWPTERTVSEPPSGSRSRLPDRMHPDRTRRQSTPGTPRAPGGLHSGSLPGSPRSPRNRRCLPAASSACL